MARAVEERAWLGRISSVGGVICGAAFVVDGEHAVSCAHVVQEAGAEGPGGTVRVDFVVLGEGCEALVLEEGWAPDAEMAGDHALLRLIDPPDGVRVLPLRSVRSLDGVDFTAYGFPQGYDTGVNTEGRLGKAAGLERAQLEVESALVVDRGFSGAAAFSERLGAVVAMLVTRDRKTEGRIAFALSVRTLAERSAIVAAALATPLELDRDRLTHWVPRSRGVSSAREDAGWLFTGRRRALSDLARWVSGTEAPLLRVVTGTPGVGKSAVLARLVTTADRHLRARIPDLDPDDPTVPAVGSIDVTFHASGRTVEDFVGHVAALSEVDADRPDRLLAALDDLDRPLVIVVDALDEATNAREICWLLSDLAARGHRILSGCRPHLLEHLSDRDPIRLDEPPYLEPREVERYVEQLLARSPSAGALQEARAVAREIAAAAEGNFLVAQLTAQAVAASGRVERPFPRNVAQAFERRLAALPDRERTRDLLLPLALAYGDGLPDELWLTAVAALRRPYQRADLDDLLSGPAASFLTTRLDAPGGRRHRLFHQALADALARSRDVVADHRLLLDTWTQALPQASTDARSWADAPPYLLESAPAHAAPAGRLDELARDVGYLLRGDLQRLLAQLAHDSVGAREETAVLRFASSRAQPLAPQRRGFLLALAARHLGLGALANSIATQAASPWRPHWAHSLGRPNQVITGHTGTVTAVAVGRVGEREVIVSGGVDATVRVWDAASGGPLGAPLTGHTSRVTAVAVGRVGEREVIVSGGLGGTVRVWDAASGGPLGAPLTGHTGPVTAVALGRVGEREVIVSGGVDGTVRVWDAASGGPLGEALTGHTGAVAVGRVGEREVIVSAGNDGTVRVWDAASGEPLGAPLTGHAGPVTAVALGRVGEREVIVSAGLDGTVRVWDAASGGPLGAPLTGHTGPVTAVALGRVGEREVIVSGGDDATVRVWDAASGGPLGAPLTGHTRRVTAVALGRVGEREVIVSAGSDATVRVWDAASGEPLGEPLTGHAGPVTAVALGRVGEREVIVSAGSDATVRVWDAASGGPLGEPLTGDTGAVAVGRVGEREVIVSGGLGGTVRVWDAASGGPLGAPLTGHTRRVTAVALGRVGEREVIVSAGDDGTVRVWDAASGEPLGEPLTGHTGPVTAVAVGRVGEREVIVSAGDDGTVRVWDAASGGPLGEPLTGHTSRVTAVALGRVGEREVIVSAGDDATVRVWDAQTRTVLHVLDTLTAAHCLGYYGGTPSLYIGTGAALSCVEPAPGYSPARLTTGLPGSRPPGGPALFSPSTSANALYHRVRGSGSNGAEMGVKR